MLHSVQHLFLSTESPSLPWVETKTQTKKEVYKPTKHGQGERRERNPGCYAKAVVSKGFPFLVSPRLAPAWSQPCSTWGCLRPPGGLDTPAPPLPFARWELIPLLRVPHSREVHPSCPPACLPLVFIPILWLREPYKSGALPAVRHLCFLLPHFCKRPQSSRGDGTWVCIPLTKWEKQINQRDLCRSPKQDCTPVPDASCSSAFALLFLSPGGRPPYRPPHAETETEISRRGREPWLHPKCLLYWAGAPRGAWPYWAAHLLALAEEPGSYFTIIYYQLLTR